MKKVISLIILILITSNTFAIDSLLLSLKQRNYNKIDSISRSYKTVEEAINGISKFTHQVDKARGVFNFVCEFMTYERYDNWVERQENPSISLEMSLKTKKGVCYDYASLYDYICSKVGLECVMIIGYIKEKCSHAWNVVTIDGKMYILDVTFGDCTNKISYNTYLIPPECAITYWYPTSVRCLDYDMLLNDGYDFVYVNLENFTANNLEALNDFDSRYKANKKKYDIYYSYVAKYQCLEKPLSIYGYIHSPIKGDGWYSGDKVVYHFKKYDGSIANYSKVYPKNDPNMYITYFYYNQ